MGLQMLGLLVHQQGDLRTSHFSFPKWQYVLFLTPSWRAWRPRIDGSLPRPPIRRAETMLSCSHLADHIFNELTQGSELQCSTLESSVLHILCFTESQFGS